MKLGQLISEYRKKHKMSMDKFADQCNLSKAYISTLEKGVDPRSGNPISPTLETYQSVAKGMNLDLQTLLSEVNGGVVNLESDNFDNILPLKGRTKKIPLLGEIACGEPILANREYELYEAIDESINADFCLKAKGDSMIGARIEDGDIVFIKECSEVYNGEIAAVIIDDSVTLKRVYYNKEQKEVVLNAENNAYAPLVFRDEELSQIRILGKAIGFQSALK